MKVVCINAIDEGSLEEGRVYECREEEDLEYINVCLGKSGEIPFFRSRFLILPEGEKTPKDMTLEEWCAINVAKLLRENGVEMSHNTHWVSATGSPVGKWGDTKYRLRPEKSKKELEIERIEGEMRKLADDLQKLKG